MIQQEKNLFLFIYLFLKGQKVYILSRYTEPTMLKYADKCTIC